MWRALVKAALGGVSDLSVAAAHDRHRLSQHHASHHRCACVCVCVYVSVCCHPIFFGRQSPHLLRCVMLQHQPGSHRQTVTQDSFFVFLEMSFITLSTWQQYFLRTVRKPRVLIRNRIAVVCSGGGTVKTLKTMMSLHMMSPCRPA